jgi:hypothetical protein
MRHDGSHVVGFELSIIRKHLSVGFSPPKDYEQVFDFESFPE